MYFEISKLTGCRVNTGGTSPQASAIITIKNEGAPWILDPVRFFFLITADKIPG